MLALIEWRWNWIKVNQSEDDYYCCWPNVKSLDHWTVLLLCTNTLNDELKLLSLSLDPSFGLQFHRLDLIWFDRSGFYPLGSSLKSKQNPGLIEISLFDHQIIELDLIEHLNISIRYIIQSNPIQNKFINELRLLYAKTKISSS